MQELYELIHEAVAREARLASNRWNHVIDADDIEQELWLFVLESPAIQDYLRTANKPQIKSALSQKADAICSKDRLDYAHFTGNFHYTPSEVRELLDESGSEYDVHQADEKIDLDLSLADLEEEKPNHFSVLWNAFREGIEPDNPVQKSRALDQLTTIMNRKRSQRESDRTEGLGTRPAYVPSEY